MALKHFIVVYVKQNLLVLKIKYTESLICVWISFCLILRNLCGNLPFLQILSVFLIFSTIFHNLVFANKFKFIVPNMLTSKPQIFEFFIRKCLIWLKGGTHGAAVLKKNVKF